MIDKAYISYFLACADLSSANILEMVNLYVCKKKGTWNVSSV